MFSVVMGIHSLDIVRYMSVKDRRRFAVYFCLSRKVRRRSPYCIRPVRDMERESGRERYNKEIKNEKGKKECKEKMCKYEAV